MGLQLTRNRGLPQVVLEGQVDQQGADHCDVLEAHDHLDHVRLRGRILDVPEVVHDEGDGHQEQKQELGPQVGAQDEQQAAQELQRRGNSQVVLVLGEEEGGSGRGKASAGGNAARTSTGSTSREKPVALCTWFLNAVIFGFMYPSVGPPSEPNCGTVGVGAAA